MRTLGILGGMGPLATVDFMAKVIAATPAARDQDHIPTVVVSWPQIPDRNTAMEGHGPTPVPAMCAALRALEAAGAQGVAIACNTAHAWIEELRAATSLPLLHIAEAADAALARRPGQVRKVGIVATAATVAAGFHQRRLAAAGREALLPDVAMQARIMAAIGAVKRGDVAAAGRALEAEIMRLVGAGADAVLLACTEVPVALDAVASPLRARCIDATAALAVASVEWSRASHGSPAAAKHGEQVA